ncbi:MAG: DivIVA domain-containing protein, partial [Bifidobacteriaceae bacterium]|nr:DivIVA domain-containing protein [Bifidobacteriaceae bacterium]
MAQLTADDVVLKGFQTTKFREGYDQVEVDDFLDEVALSMRAMAAENEELRSQLAAAEARIAELERTGPGGPAEPAEAPAPPVPSFGLPPAAPPSAGPPAAPPSPGLVGPLTPGLAVPPPAPAPPAPPAPVGGPAASAQSEAETATGMLALANKLHEQYVKAGQ